ncbi:MAG TPA: glycosyltransferase 87 family protein [Gaiellaceae bacterium]
MTARRAAAAGALVFLVTCLLPRYGLGARALDTSLFRLWSDRMLAGRIPYRDFSLEYPPGALPAFVIPGLLPGDYGFWFKAFQALCGAVAVGAVAYAGETLGLRGTRLWLAVGFAALAPLALGPLVLIRFDLWPTALAAVGLAAILRGRNGLGFGALALGTAAKLFPFVLMPLGLLYVLRREGRPSARRALVWFVAVLAVVVLPFALLGPGGLRFSVAQQAGRALQIESVGSALLLAAHELGAYSPHAAFASGSWNLTGGLPHGVGLIETLVQILAVVAVWVAFARSRRTPAQLALAAAAAVVAFAVLGRVLSPQYLLWVVPLVALLAPRLRTAAGLLVVGLLLTRAIYPARYDALVAFEATPIWLLVARDALLLTLGAQIGIASRRK